MKLVSTTYYGHNIVFAKKVYELCKELFPGDRPDETFDRVYTHANKTYNNGYTVLNKPDVIRPTLMPPEFFGHKGIGGHCQIPNAVLLHEAGFDIGIELLKAGYENKQTYKDKNWLYAEYYGKDKTIKEIANDVNLSPTAISNWLDRHNIIHKKTSWTPQEDSLLEELSLEMTFKEISDGAYLSRTYEAIRIRASKLNINSPYDPSKCDKITKEKISCTLQKIPYKDFKGFVLSENEKVRHSLKYLEWRKSVFVRDNWKCAITGQTGFLNAHHIENFSKNDKLRLDVDNGITLHQEVHKLLHKLYGNNVSRETLEQFKKTKELKTLIKTLR
jgi:hypothetical protein